MNIKIQSTNKDLSSYGGLICIQSLMDKLGLEQAVRQCIPSQKRGSKRNHLKFENLVLGLVAGAECLDDMSYLSQDPGMSAFFCKSYHPKSYGDFLRSFTGENLWRLQSSLIQISNRLRRAIFPDQNKLVFDCDSTLNQQYGKKMEGVETNYQKFEGLSTLNIYDQFGFQYFTDVRPGATHTSFGIEDPVHRLLSHIIDDYKGRAQKRPKICFRADSGYYSVSFINACLAKYVDILICVNKKEPFNKILTQVTNWRQQNTEDPHRILFYDSRECEIGSTVYRPTGASQRLRYVILRAEKPTDENEIFQSHKEYDYFAFCTNYSENLFTDEEVIRLYRKRGQAENFIRENKYGFDLKHYPCLKLNANRAYALIAMVAYNLIRFMALMHNSQNPHYAKKIRNTWIRIPCMVARTARDSVFRFMDHHLKEIKVWLKRIHIFAV